MTLDELIQQRQQRAEDIKKRVISYQKILKDVFGLEAELEDIEGDWYRYTCGRYRISCTPHGDGDYDGIYFSSWGLDFSCSTDDPGEIDLVKKILKLVDDHNAQGGQQ